MGHDFKRVEETLLSAGIRDLSPESLAIVLNILSSNNTRDSWFYDGEYISDSKWDEADAALSLAFTELTETYVCPPGGGAADYTLVSTDVLGSDQTTYSIVDLDLLSGEDLLIEVIAANDSGGRRDLRIRFNDDDDNVYYQQRSIFDSVTTLALGNQVNIRCDDAVPQLATPQLIWGYITIDVPQWKQSTVYHPYHCRFHGSSEHGIVGGRWSKTETIEKVTFFTDNGDLVTGSQFRVYTRG